MPGIIIGISAYTHKCQELSLEYRPTRIYCQELLLEYTALLKTLDMDASV